jgi:hypothetical protein
MRFDARSMRDLSDAKRPDMESARRQEQAREREQKLQQERDAAEDRKQVIQNRIAQAEEGIKEAAKRGTKEHSIWLPSSECKNTYSFWRDNHHKRTLSRGDLDDTARRIYDHFRQLGFSMSIEDGASGRTPAYGIVVRW